MLKPAAFRRNPHSSHGSFPKKNARNHPELRKNQFLGFNPHGSLSMSSFLFDEALNSWHEIPNDEIFIIWDLLFDGDKKIGFL